jgi:dTMP kinase
MGKIIVLDGIDGSGKKTQAELLYNFLKSKDYNVHKFSFPAYDSGSSSLVRMYLNGDFGEDAEKLNPYVCSSFFAVDRFVQYVINWEKIYSQRDAILIFDRYISANAIHQGAKIKSTKEREQFYRWLYEYEVGFLKLPKEDITILLDVPVQVSKQLLIKRNKEEGSKNDIHEKNLKYLDDSYKSMVCAYVVYRNAGYNWHRVKCVDDFGNLRNEKDILKDIIKLIKPILDEVGK